MQKASPVKLLASRHDRRQLGPMNVSVQAIKVNSAELLNAGRAGKAKGNQVSAGLTTFQDAEDGVRPAAMHLLASRCPSPPPGPGQQTPVKQTRVRASAAGTPRGHPQAACCPEG